MADTDRYGPDRTVPDYRTIRTSLAYKTNGYIPAGYGMLREGVDELPNSPYNQIMAPIWDSISNVLSMIESIKAGNGIYRHMDEEVERRVRSYFRCNIPSVMQQIRILMHLDETQIQAIPERVKDKVLDWALALERAGVTGDGMTFTDDEKRIAHSVTFNINNSHIEQLSNLGTNLKGN